MYIYIYIYIYINFFFLLYFLHLFNFIRGGKVSLNLGFLYPHSLQRIKALINK